MPQEVVASLRTVFIVLFNHMPDANGEIPLSEIAARIQDILKFMRFHCWQEVFVEKPDGGEEEAWWAMPAMDTGDELTCLVALKESEALVPHSNVRAAKDPLHPNLRLRPRTDDLRSPKEWPTMLLLRRRRAFRQRLLANNGSAQTLKCLECAPQPPPTESPRSSSGDD